MTGYVVTSEVDALMYVVLSRAGRHMPYVCRTKQGKKTHALWGICWYHRMYNVIAEMSHGPRSS